MAAFTPKQQDLTMCVYTITHNESGRIYVGQTRRRVGDRWRGHIDRAKNCGLTHIQRALKKYGKSAFAFDVIDIAESDEQLDHKERFWIKELNSLTPNGFNLDSGGNARKVVTADTRAKQSAAKKGKAGTWQGKSHSEESKELIRSKKIGVPLTKKWKQVLRSDGIVFSSVSAATEALGVSRSSVTRVLTGKRKSLLGFTFEYLKGELS